MCLGMHIYRITFFKINVFCKNCELISTEILNKWQSRWQEETTRPGSWLGNMWALHAGQVALFSPVHLCELFSHPSFIFP